MVSLKKKQIDNNRHVWKAYTALCIFLIIINAALIIFYYPYAGWDYDFVCASAHAFSDGKDPFVKASVQEYLETVFTFRYAPISLPFFSKLVCIIPMNWYYYSMWAILAFLSFYIVYRNDKNRDPLLLATILFSGFLAVTWNFASGNVNLFEILLFSIALSFLLKKKYCPSAIFVGLSSVVKVMPLVFSVAFLGIPKLSLKKKIGLFLTAVLIFSITHLLSFILFPRITKTYILGMLGLVPSQLSPMEENAAIGGALSPSSLFFFRDLLQKYLFFSVLFQIIFYSLFVVFVFILFLTWHKNAKNATVIETFSFSIIGLMLVLPRLQPYFFTFALVPIYFLMKKLSVKEKLFLIFLACFLPIPFLFIRYVMRITDIFLLEYSSFLLLLFFYIFILIRKSKKVEG